MNLGQQPAAWHELAATFATIAAALFGLFFVAMVLHLDAISTNVTIRARARVSLQSLALAVALRDCGRPMLTVDDPANEHLLEFAAKVQIGARK